MTTLSTVLSLYREHHVHVSVVSSLKLIVNMPKVIVGEVARRHVYSNGLVRPAWLLVFLPCPPSRSAPHAHRECHQRSGLEGGNTSSEVGTAAAPPRQLGPAYPKPEPPSMGDSKGTLTGSANGLDGFIVGDEGEVTLRGGWISYGLWDERVGDASCQA